jgi:hypothetical protein
MNQALVLFLSSFPSLIGYVHFCNQARNLLFGYIPSLACSPKLFSQNRDPLGRFGHFTVSDH